jgi:hypothetical protein
MHEELTRRVAVEVTTDGRSGAAWLDAAGLVHDVGLATQAVALTMWKHEVVSSLGICQGCGRPPERSIPLFGPRCEVAVGQWDQAHESMRRLVAVADRHQRMPLEQSRAIGRAPVPPSKEPAEGRP